MHSLEIKKKFIEFFKSKDHKELANVSLIPENDPTALFINSGVHPIVPNILQGSHPLGKRLCSVQRCMRTTDIEEVGDNRHHTFFEMLGNWSIGDYFKKEALEWSMEFFVDQLKLDPNRIYASIFEGEGDIPRDDESIEIWKEIFKKHGIEAEVFDEKNPSNPKARIFALDKEENFWGPAGQTGPCGPSSEFHYRFSKGEANLAKSRPGFNDGEEFVELWNNVFMEFEKTKDGKFIPLKQKNVDTGAGFERVCLITQFRDKDGSMDGNFTVYNTDLFDTPLSYLRSLIEDESKKSTYEENTMKVKEFDPTLTELKNVDETKKAIRIILDHIRACTFLIGDGVEPSNKDQGYILRRLIRRTVRHAKLLGITQNITKDMAELYIDKYKVQYPQLEQNADKILNTLEKEEVNFEDVIKRGVKEIDKLEATGKKITGKDLFNVYETYGYPIEMALDELGITDPTLQEKYTTEFEEAKKEHQKQSRKGAGKFKGGLADHTEISKRYHTATHLLLKALQMVLGDHVHQRGSNITEERLRFDFSHPDKLTDEQIKKVEKIVNEKIKEGLNVFRSVIYADTAKKIHGVQMEFKLQYPNIVSVYSIGLSANPIKGKLQKRDNIISRFKGAYSVELCGGPHVDNTSELAKSGKFRIIREESCGSGIRRIKAVLK